MPGRSCKLICRGLEHMSVLMCEIGCLGAVLYCVYLELLICALISSRKTVAEKGWDNVYR